MKWIFVLALLFVAACDSTITNPVAPLDTPFWLNYGEHRILAPDNVTIGFQKVLQDSRCGLKCICIWPGRSDILIWLKSNEIDSTFVTASIFGYITKKNTCCHLSVDTLGYQITLLQLEPYREASETIQPSKYKALLKISKVP